MVLRRSDFSVFTPKPLTSPKSSISFVMVGMAVSSLWLMTASSAKAKTSAPGIEARRVRRGSYARMKRRGERGQPCLTPRCMPIVVLDRPPSLGLTWTSCMRPLTRFSTQAGMPILVSTSKRKGWSMESKALAVSIKRKNVAFGRGGMSKRIR